MYPIFNYIHFIAVAINNLIKMEKGDSGMKIQKRSISESVDKHKSGKFGYFGINPFFLQWMNSPWVFLVLIMLAMIGNSKYLYDINIFWILFIIV